MYTPTTNMNTQNHDILTFIRSLKYVKCLETNLSKDVRVSSFGGENYKTLWNCVDVCLCLSLWEYIVCSWTGKLSIINMPFLFKVIYRVRVILTKIPKGCVCVYIDKPILMFTLKNKHSRANSLIKYKLWFVNS